METKIKREYYSNGQPMYECPKLNGKFHGIQKWWWNNGVISYIWPYLNGQAQGMSQDWNYGGTRESILQSKNHNRHGPNIKFKYKK